MKAAVSARYGPPSVVRVVDVPAPTVGPDDVLIKVSVATVNRTDAGFRAGHPWFARVISGALRPKARVLGCEFAGVVTGTGAHVMSYKLGDRVFGFSEFRFGAHAEYLSMPSNGSLALIPSDLTFEQAAPTTEGSHYALSMIDHADVTADQSVLVYGASGAIGSAAVQLLRQRGVHVTAVCGTDGVSIVSTLGAQRVIDHEVSDFTKLGDTFDVVIDAVGKTTLHACKPLLKRHGVFVSGDLGPRSQNLWLPLTTRWTQGQRALFPLPPRHTQAGTEYIRTLLASGEFRPVIDRVFELDDIVLAYEYVETQRKIGNVLIHVAN